MATSVGGLTSIDVNSIVSQLMTVERQPLQALQKTLSGIQTKISAFSKIQNQLSTLQDAARGLKDATLWTSASAASSDTTIARASASSGAITGSYSLVVQNLAQRQTIASTAYPTADSEVGLGTLSIQMGTYDNTAPSFVDDPARVAIQIDLSSPPSGGTGWTLAQIRDQINQADSGVQASLVTDSSGVRLMLRSEETGAENAFRITGSGDLAGLSVTPDRSLDPSDPSFNAGATMTMPMFARDASATINGLQITSASNKLDGVIENLTIDLMKGNNASAEIEVATDNSTIRAAVDKFVSAWNSLNTTLRDLTKYDEGSKTAGTLQGNGTVIGLQRQLRSLLGETVDGSTLARLSDAGIELGRDGSLSVKSSRFDAALANPSNLQALFAAGGTDVAGQGIARRFDTLLTSVLGLEGALSAATDSLTTRKNSVTDQQDAFERRMTLIEARLRRQYTALDAQVAQFGSTMSFLSSKFGQG